MPRRSTHETFYNEIAQQLTRDRSRPYRLELPDAHVMLPAAFAAAMRKRGLHLRAKWLADQDPPALLLFDVTTRRPR
jgi:hypothetical protein